MKKSESRSAQGLRSVVKQQQEWRGGGAGQQGDKPIVTQQSTQTKPSGSKGRGTRVRPRAGERRARAGVGGDSLLIRRSRCSDKRQPALQTETRLPERADHTHTRTHTHVSISCPDVRGESKSEQRGKSPQAARLHYHWCPP